MKKIGIIGFGNMGQAMYAGLVDVFGEDRVFVCYRNLEKLKIEDLRLENFSKGVDEVIKKVDVVIIAVKPQSFAEFAKSMTVDVNDKLVVSIMAGITLEKLKEKTGTKKVLDDDQYLNGYKTQCNQNLYNIVNNLPNKSKEVLECYLDLFSKEMDSVIIERQEALEKEKNSKQPKEELIK